MEMIPSFQVDHEKLLPGIYESRVDVIGEEMVTTFDIRMKRPNAEPVIHGNAMHTIEHIVATFLRNDRLWKDKVVYWGPMGCLTGCYLIVKGRPSSKEILPIMIEAFKNVSEFEGEIPGATPVNCGNYIFMDLNSAKYEAKKFVEVLENDPCLDYEESFLRASRME